MTPLYRYVVELVAPDEASMLNVGDAIFEAVQTVDMPDGVKLRTIRNEGRTP